MARQHPVSHAGPRRRRTGPRRRFAAAGLVIRGALVVAGPACRGRRVGATPRRPRGPRRGGLARHRPARQRREAPGVRAAESRGPHGRHAPDTAASLPHHLDDDCDGPAPSRSTAFWTSWPTCPTARSAHRIEPTAGAALWNLFSDAGRTVAIVGWWATWPAETVHGVIVSDGLAPVDQADDARRGRPRLSGHAGAARARAREDSAARPAGPRRPGRLRAAHTGQSRRRARGVGDRRHPSLPEQDRAPRRRGRELPHLCGHRGRPGPHGTDRPARRSTSRTSTRCRTSS